MELIIENGIGFLYFNRPEIYNPLDLATARELYAYLRKLSVKKDVKAVVISGRGKAFCAGGDIRAVLKHKDGPAAAFHEMAINVQPCIMEMRNMSKPIIAAINGVAAGGGFSISLAADFRIIDPKAVMKLGFTSNALSVDAAGTFNLPRIVGNAKALEIATFDEPLNAEEALRIGLVNKISEEGKVVDYAKDYALKICEKSLHTFSWSKRLINSSFESTIETQMEKEHQALVSCVSHPDGMEGITAFVEKRKAKFNAED
ncbi:MAG: enoyl-CoA hydratase [Marinilabiliales bacterium]|nr:MAG: enoyl-CoA hydratase [Marinilabiliales bacterium]